MGLLIAGVLLWWGVHLFKRALPAARSLSTDRMGDASRAPFALLILLSVVLMVIGYRAAPFEPVYQPIAGIGITVVIFGIFAGVHIWLGKNPFMGTFG